MPMDVQVVSPDGKLFAGPADFLLARTVEGEIGILVGHAPILAQLAPSEVKVRSGSTEQKFELAGGFMSVKDDKVIVLAEEGPASEPGA